MSASRSCSGVALALGTLAFLLGAAPDARPGAAQDGAADLPRFVDFDPATLECEVPSRRPKDTEGLLVVDVKNLSRAFVQPLCFEVEIETQKKSPSFPTHSVLQRVLAPYHGRVGRAVPPKGKARYLLPMPPTSEERVRLHVRVTEASAYETAVYEDCPVQVTPISETAATLLNTAPYPVRVILRPSADALASVLFAEDLAPSETRQVGAAERPSLYTSVPPELPPVYGTFGELRVDDWSVHLDPARDTARLLAESAWLGRQRWPDPGAQLDGRVRYRIEGESFGEGSKAARGETAFSLAGAELRLEDRKLDGQRVATLRAAIAKAYEELRRPSFADWAKGRRLSLHQLGARSEILVEELPSTKEPGPKDSHLLASFQCFEADRLLSVAGEGVHSRIETHYGWVRGPAGLHQLVSETKFLTAFGSPTPLERLTYEYGTAGEVPVVSRLLQERFAGTEVGGTVELEFSELVVKEARVRLAAPSGAGAAALAEVWEAGYRTPAGHDVTGRFTVSTPDRPMDWRGRPETKGAFSFRGWRSGVEPFAAADTVVEKGSEDERRSLGDLFCARTTIWTRFDLSGRPPFAEAFAGAVVERHPGEPNRFDIDHPQYREIRVEDGRILEILEQDGTRLRFRHGDFHGVPVVREARVGFPDRECVVRLDWADLGEGLLFPERVQIEDWFAKGWKETYGLEARLER